MIDDRPIKPTVDIPLSDAVQQLTGFEALGIERRYDRKMEDIGGIGLTIGVVWAYENRNGNKRSWTAAEAMTLEELTNYFAPEPEDFDPADPDSTAGKGD